MAAFSWWAVRLARMLRPTLRLRFSLASLVATHSCSWTGLIARTPTIYIPSSTFFLAVSFSPVRRKRPDFLLKIALLSYGDRILQRGAPSYPNDLRYCHSSPQHARFRYELP